MRESFSPVCRAHDCPIVPAVNEADRTRVLFVTPEELLDLIGTLATAMPEKETTVRGYKLKTRHQALGAKEKSARQKVLSQVVLESLKRLNE